MAPGFAEKEKAPAGAGAFFRTCGGGGFAYLVLTQPLLAFDHSYWYE